MATTTAFGWETPDDTDLVKDGAAAIRTLGSSIDTSMSELKGGTTGQVLSKTSATDMDFTWVTSDDANAIQNAIVDAKGDIIAATANDTPARLAVGANDTVLTADSAQSTGLKYAVPDANKPWTNYTPTITSQVGTITTVSASGTYLNVGQSVFFSVQITITAAGTGTGFIRASLPLTPNFACTGTAQNTNTTGVGGVAQIPSLDAGAYIATATNTTFIASGAIIVASGMYRIA